MRRIVIGLAGGLLLLAGLYTAAWFYVAGRLTEAIDAWAVAQRAAGWTVDYGAPAVSGFPVRATARLREPAVAAPGGAWRVAAPALTVTVTLAAPHQATFETAGHIAMGFVDGRSAGLDVAAARVVAHAPAADGQHVEATLDAPQLAVAQTPLKLAARTATAAAVIHPAPAGPDQPAFDLRIGLDQLTGLVLPGGPDSVSLDGSATLKGQLPPGRLSQSVPAWRDQGGVIELHRLQLDAGLQLTVEGTLALDGDLRPLGAGTAVLRNADVLLPMLAAAGRLDAKQLPMARILLAALAKPGADGKPEIRAPVTAQDGWLTLGPLKVAPLAPLRLP